MQRWKVSIAVAFAVVALLFLVVPSVVLVVFSGLLMAAFLNGGGGLIARSTRLPVGWGIGVFTLIVVAAVSAVIAFAATAIAGQFDELTSQLPGALEALRDRLSHYGWGEWLMDRANPAGLLSGEGGRAASTAVSTTFGALGNFVIIVFIGLYVAIDPGLYRRGVVRLFAPSLRPRAGEVLVKAAHTVKTWLGAQLIAMAVVGLLTGTGLFLIGMPLAIILGVIAGLLAFIPNIGPVIAIVPALLLAFPEGPSMILWVLVVYLSVQTLESYLITPLIQQERVNLAPALVIGAQLFFGVMFGLLGLALAMPLVALAMMLTRELYIRDFLEREPTLRLPE